MKRKGVSVVFEQVLLFMIGVAIFITSYAIFNSYERLYSETVMGDQLAELGNWVASHIILLSEKADTANTSMNLRVPELVAREHYEINLSQDGLHLLSFARRKSVNITLRGINESFSLDGNFSTFFGTLLNIEKREDRISIS